MSKSYTVIGNTSGLKIGDTITDDDLNKNHPGLGGAERLLKLGAIREGAGPAPAPGGPGGTVEQVHASEATGMQNTRTIGRGPRP